MRDCQARKYRVTCSFLNPDGTETPTIADGEDIARKLRGSGYDPRRVITYMYHRFAKALLESIYPGIQVTCDHLTDSQGTSHGPPPLR